MSNEIIKIANKEYANDFPLRLHVTNVATMATCVAGMTGLDEDLAFNAGLLHDIGKMYCGLNIIPDHPALTFKRLKELGVSDKINGVASVHHHFQIHRYPDFPRSFLEVYTNIPEAELISLCDKVEAGMTRSNEHPINAIDNAKKVFKYNDLYTNALKKLLIG